MMRNKFYRYFFAICCVLTSIHATAASDTVPLDKVVAIVNSTPITQSQLDARIADLKRGIVMSGAPLPDQAQIRKQALDQVIDRQLQLDVAERNKVVVTDAQINEALGKIAAQNHMNLEQLKAAIIKDGLDYKRFRTQIHDQMVIHELQQGLFGKQIVISDAEVKALMRKGAPQQTDQSAAYHLDDLLIPLADSASPADVAAAQKRAQDLLAKARQGTSFADLAKNEAGAAGAVQQIDLGWRRVNDLPTIFVSQVPNMTVGSFAGPIQAPNGLHIIKLLEVQGQAKPLTEAEAKNLLFQQKINVRIDSWLQQLRKSAYVKIM